MVTFSHQFPKVICKKEPFLIFCQIKKVIHAVPKKPLILDRQKIKCRRTSITPSKRLSTLLIHKSTVPWWFMTILCQCKKKGFDIGFMGVGNLCRKIWLFFSFFSFLGCHQGIITKEYQRRSKNSVSA